MNEPSRREDTPFWWEDAPVKRLPQQPLAKKLDVLIVGAGYAGLSAGLALAREGRSVAAFDAMNPGRGGFDTQRRHHQRQHPARLRHDHPALR